MDTSAVIQLSCQAAESVLRFRAVGFTRRPVIDLQSFRAAITAQIEKAAKDHQHRFEVPLAEVVNYAGIGASRAARQWNGVSHKENHVAIEWFRNCVCNLVSGVVSDIGQMAFEDQGMNACMYLEPDDYDPFDVPSYSTAALVNKSSQYIPSRANDSSGSQEVEIEEEPEISPTFSSTSRDSNTTSASSETLPLRHEIEKGYKAVEQLAASQGGTSARADFIKTTKRLRTVSEPPYDDQPPETLLKRPAKRARQYCSAPHMLPSGPTRPAVDNASKSLRNSWTDEEISVLMSARELGRSWFEIGNMLPRHTNPACQTKYRIVKNKQAKDKEADAALRIPAIDESSESDEDQGHEDGVKAGPIQQQDDGVLTAAGPARLNGFHAVNNEVVDHDAQSDKEN